MYQYIIDHCIEAGCFDSIYVDTDSEDIKHYCFANKVKWIERNLNPAPKHIIKQSDKRPYAAEESGKPNLLIDDWTHNLESWLNGGGIAVRFDETDSQSNLQAVSDILTGRG